MYITDNRLASIIVRFFIEEKKFSYYKLAIKVEVDSNTIKSWKSQTQNIQSSSFEKLKFKLKDDISLAYDKFSKFLIGELEKDGINRKYTREILNSTNDVNEITEKIQKIDITEHKYLQGVIGTNKIIQILKSLLCAYREHFQVSEKSIGESETKSVYDPLIHKARQSEDFHSDINNLILKFPNSYNVGIVLSNYEVDYEDFELCNYYFFMVEKLKTQNDLKMLLFITDIDEKSIPFSIQSSLMEKYNLFFEFVNKNDLQEISVQSFKLREEVPFNLSNLLDQHRYAQLIFERFMSYLSVISNEIIFQPYLEKAHKELDLENPLKADAALSKILVSYQKRTNARNFTNYASEVLIRDICQYSYLSRHAIYHERTLVADEVALLLDERNTQKIPLAVEICAPNSLTTCNIIEKCERLLLFTTSHNAYSLMTKLEEKSDNHFFPSNVSLLLSHLNPEYMMHQYSDELNGKVDLLVIGYGAGSQINDLTRFIRYAYNWLSENGVLFISVYNKEAIVLNKYHIHDQRFESYPLYISDYWTYTANEQVPLLKNLKAYSPENFPAAYLSLFDAESINVSTYPYISALINPNEYSRAILDEIREADKLFASRGKHGQLINIIAHKNESVKKSNITIRNYLTKFNIQYNYYVHTLVPDSKSFRQSLHALNVPMSDVTLLKTVVLQERNPKSLQKNCWSYAILPYDNQVIYDQVKYELVPETSVFKRFYQGPISPLTILAERVGNCQLDENIFLLNNDCITTEYVIMGGGSNTESIRIKTEDFRNLIANADVLVKDKIE